MEITTSMTTCPNGHHYDAAKHATCPYCGGQRANGFKPTEPLSPSGAFPSTAPPTGAYAPAGGRSSAFAPTEPPSAVSGRSPNFTATVPPDLGGANRSSGHPSGGVNPFSSPTVIGGSAKTAGSNTEPVVGWLVCVDGPSRGKDYKIRTGYNYIGREVGDIKIEGDQQISRQNHAMLAYVQKDRKFYVGPVAGLNIIEVNGNAVLQSAVEIHNYDIISVGTTKLIFVGLCGAEFSWDKKVGSDD